MKKHFIAKISVLLASVMLVCAALTGCDFFGMQFGASKEYTIQSLNQSPQREAIALRTFDNLDDSFTGGK